MPVTTNEQNQLPKWDLDSENPDHVTTIRGFKVIPCMEYQDGNCCMGRQCFEYHDESEMRRPVADQKGQILYWDVMCQFVERGQPCPYGYGCGYAHTEDERVYHPGQFKTSVCKSKEMAHPWEATSKKDRRQNAHKYAFKAPQAVKPQQAVCEPCNDGMPSSYKFRFCAYYPNVEQCRRKEFCSFAHSREEIRAPLLSVKEEAKRDLSNQFFTERFKIHWCPIGVQHDWQTCVYAHNYQDARRDPSIGYGPRPCPYWEKKDRAPSYESRCPNGFRCPYAHGAKEQLYHPGYFKTVVCWDYNQGSKGCPRGNLCAFYHKKKLQRKTLEDATDYNNPLSDENMSKLQLHFRAPPFFSGDDKDALAMGLGGRNGRNANRENSNSSNSNLQWSAQQMPAVCPPVFVPGEQWGGSSPVMGCYDGSSPMGSPGMAQMQPSEMGTPMMMNAHPDSSMMFMPNSPSTPFASADRPMSPMQMQGSPMQGNSPHGNMMGMLMPIFPAIDEHGQAAMPNRFMPPMGMSGQDGMFNLVPVDALPQGPPHLALPQLSDGAPSGSDHEAAMLSREKLDKHRDATKHGETKLQTVNSMTTADGSSNGLPSTSDSDTEQKQANTTGTFDFHPGNVPFFVDDE